MLHSAKNAENLIRYTISGIPPPALVVVVDAVATDVLQVVVVVAAVAVVAEVLLDPSPVSLRRRRSFAPGYIFSGG